jgi:hypothetical protein
MKNKHIICICLMLLIILIAGRFTVYNSYCKMKQLKTTLVSHENELTTVYDKLNRLKTLTSNLENAKQFKMCAHQDDELKSLIRQWMCPQSDKFSDARFDLQFNSVEPAQLDFQLTVDSPFNCLGDYFEHLESTTLPLVVNDMIMTPTNHEFDVIRAQFDGTIYLLR